MDKIKFPPIEIKFASSAELNEHLLTVYVKTVNDVINAARGDTKSLKDIHDFAKEVVWVTDSLVFEAENPEGEKRI